MGKELRLNELHQLYLQLKRGIPWFDHLLLGLLVWVEEWVISFKVTTEVDKAVNSVELEPMPDCVTPVYTVSPSDTSVSLPEMRLTAPWYKEG